MKLKLVIVGTTALFISGCMMKSTHEEFMSNMKKQMTDVQMEITKERDEQTRSKEECDKANQKLSADLAARDIKINQILDEKGALDKERTELSEEQEKLARELEDLRKLKVATEKRNADYRTLLHKLAKMIDSGTLKVKIRNGLMQVQMSSDVVFPSASVKIKPEAKQAIQELAATISTFSDRRFQVMGHCDPTPIRTARFPSNWELSTQRAIEVVKQMIEAGVPPEMISAAGAAQFDPVTENETPEGRSQNRRVEIIFLPTMGELPGVEEALSVSK